ncbi:hypothetical protein BG023_112305 [Porphyrobacter sp. LM 6]|nr:hypothetical protein BG023_112305 [Porphyrobacter sp. LM 6]
MPPASAGGLYRWGTKMPRLTIGWIPPEKLSGLRPPSRSSGHPASGALSPDGAMRDNSG